MKIALYIEDGLEQIILTPETKTERSLLQKLHDDDRELQICRGAFYETRGGWVRQGPTGSGLYDPPDSKDESTMIVLRKRAEEGATLAEMQ
jgi:hypothetical protein